MSLKVTSNANLQDISSIFLLETGKVGYTYFRQEIEMTLKVAWDGPLHRPRITSY